MKVNEMGFRKLIPAAAALALISQSVWAQSAVGSPDHVAAVASAAARLGRTLPVSSDTAAGKARPYVWVARSLGPRVISGASLPGSWSCNTSLSSGGPYVFCPSGIQTAYGVSQIVGGNGGMGTTIAIVVAYDYSGAEADLTSFSANMGLPLCTSASGCFMQVSQTGGTPVAVTDRVWELETMLDLEYAHAMAPKAKLLLVEATTADLADLLVAVNYGAAHADIVSSSWGAPEISFPTVTGIDGQLPTGKPLLFASGDSAAVPNYPCTSSMVTCVGGTTLTVSGAFQRTLESGWANSGGGCSAQIGPQFWQSFVGGITSIWRCTPDIAADADPNTGVAVLDSGNGGYYLVGGTSLAASMMAGLFADMTTARIGFAQTRFGNMSPTLYSGAQRNYSYFYYDVTLGNNGYPAGTGYDLVTGLGVPKTSAMANRFFGLVIPHSVTLNWTASASSNVKGYNVYRGLVSGGETPLFSLIAGVAYTDNNVQAGPTYYYVVTTVDGDDNESGPSNEISCQVGAGPSCVASP